MLTKYKFYFETDNFTIVVYKAQRESKQPYVQRLYNRLYAILVCEIVWGAKTNVSSTSILYLRCLKECIWRRQIYFGEQ